MADRGKEIEAFYWMLMRLLGIAFGYLTMLGGAVFALAFAAEKLRTGAVAIGGTTYPDAAMALKLIGGAALVAVSGWAVVRWIRARSERKDSV